MYHHWSYKRYLERTLRDNFDFIGTPIKIGFRDEKQIKANREKAEREALKAAQPQAPSDTTKE